MNKNRFARELSLFPMWTLRYLGNPRFSNTHIARCLPPLGNRSFPDPFLPPQWSKSKKRSLEANAFCYRLLHCGALRAFLRPNFRRSLARASRLRSPSFLRAPRKCLSYSVSARAIPREIAPA